MTRGPAEPQDHVDEDIAMRKRCTAQCVNRIHKRTKIVTTLVNSLLLSAEFHHGHHIRVQYHVMF